MNRRFIPLTLKTERILRSAILPRIIVMLMLNQKVVTKDLVSRFDPNAHPSTIMIRLPSAVHFKMSAISLATEPILFDWYKPAREKIQCQTRISMPASRKCLTLKSTERKEEKDISLRRSISKLSTKRKPTVAMSATLKPLSSRLRSDLIIILYYSDLLQLRPMPFWLCKG